MAFPVGQETKKQVGNCLTHLHGDDKSTGLSIRHVPIFGCVNDQETGRHTAQSKKDLRRQIPDKIPIAAHHFRQGAHISHLRDRRFCVFYRRLARQAEKNPGKKHQDGGGNK